jgi:putrescine aminotransferase
VRVFAHARDHGVLVRPLGDGVALSPPLIATREDVDTAASAIADALDAVASDLGVAAAA